MPRRASLDDALGPREEPKPSQPPFAGELQHAPRHPMEPEGAEPAPVPSDARYRDAEEETYKMTVVLTESERLALEKLTEVVIAEVNPRRVGKGWRTKSIRMLLELVGENPAWQYQVAANVKAREERQAEKNEAARRRTR